MHVGGTSTNVLNIAKRLVAHEGIEHHHDQPSTSAVFHVCEKMRGPLSTLTGVAGFHALLARALHLAKRETQSLEALNVKADGTLEGSASDSGGALLVATFITLLITFMGEALTMRLLHEIWLDLIGDSLSSAGTQR